MRLYLSDDVMIATVTKYQMKTATRKKIYLFFIEFLFVVVVSVDVDND